jgi:hypothetical protein
VIFGAALATFSRSSGKIKPFKQDMFVKHMENEIPNAKCSVITLGNEATLFDHSRQHNDVFVFAVLPIDVHDKSRENVVVVVGLGKLQEHLG